MQVGRLTKILKFNVVYNSSSSFALRLPFVKNIDIIYDVSLIRRNRHDLKLDIG